MLTVKDLLTIKAIKGIRLVAGEQGLNNKISIVNIIENPEVFDWLRSNELMLSTGYIFKENEQLQNRVIKELAEINCAGLVIKMKRYFEHIPQNMIDLANHYGFPLLELPFEYTLSNVIAVINEKTNTEYDTWNRRSLDVHNTLFRIALEGGGLDKISIELSNTVNNPIVIMDKDFKLLHYTDQENNPSPLTSIFQLVYNIPLFPKSFTDSIPKQMSEFKKSIKRMILVKDQEYKCSIMPVVAANYLYGYIVVIQTIRELTEYDYIALEHASTILALERIKAKEIEEVKLKIRQDFYDDLLTGKIISEENVYTLCSLHGLNPSYMYYTIVIQIESIEYESCDNMVTRKYKLEHTAQKCVELIYSLASKGSGELTCFYRNNRIILLVGKHENRPSITASEATGFAHEIYDRLSKSIKKTVYRIGVGNQYKNIHLLHKSFSEANEALRLIERFNDQKIVSHYHDYFVYHFLDSNIKVQDMEDFFDKCLGEVYEYDQRNGTTLMVTLENFFAYNQNVSQGARAMYIHRNTFTYRLDKIKELLNTDFQNSEELLQIQLALKIYRLLGK